MEDNQQLGCKITGLNCLHYCVTGVISNSTMNRNMI